MDKEVFSDKLKRNRNEAMKSSPALLDQSPKHILGLDGYQLSL